MADLRILADLLSGGTGAAREQAARVLGDLRERGLLSAEEAEQIERAVSEAVRANRAFLEERVLGPLRGAAGVAAQALAQGTLATAAQGRAAPETAAKLAALERQLRDLDSRLTRLEDLHRVDGGSADDDPPGGETSGEDTGPGA